MKTIDFGRHEILPGFTTQVANTAFDDNRLCHRDDYYKSVGSLITEDEIRSLLYIFSLWGFKAHWDCLVKAQAACAYLSGKERGQLVLHIGSLFVISEKNNSSYGYAYNPPLEIHAWAFSKKQGAIYDLALPGVIKSGLEASDELGPYLVGVEPVVMAERVPAIPNIYRYQMKEESVVYGP